MNKNMTNLSKFSGAFIGAIALVSVSAAPAVVSAQEVFDGYFGGGEVFDGYFGGGEVSDGYFGGGEISDGYFGGGEVFDGYFGSGEVSDGYFGNGEIYDGYFGSGEISDGYFGNGEIYDGYFGSGEISDGYFGSGTIQDGYFGSGTIQDGYFGSGTIQDGYFGSGTIQDGYFGGGTVQDGYRGAGTVQDGYLGTPTYNASCGCYETSYGASSGGSFGGGFGGGFKMPSFGGMSIVPPSYPTPPRPTPTPHYPQPTPPRPTPTTPSTPININNVNTNTNTNTNVNTNVTTVTPVTPGPIVQYVYPYSQQYPTYYPTQAPYCVITASNQYNYGNGMISLTWSSSGATSAYITPGLGQVAPNGSTTLYGYNNTVYTMTVSGPNGSYTCHTQSYVNPITPVSPYVSLTQIPYTGLALGPIGNALYWMGLISVAVAGAYLLVYYKGGMLALAGQTLSASMARRSQEEEATPVEAPHQEKVAALAHLPVQETTTRDAMKIVRSEDGTPRLVISRA
jgi:hypothetical protein